MTDDGNGGGGAVATQVSTLRDPRADQWGGSWIVATIAGLRLITAAATAAGS